jgi:hypothetical protein
MRSPFQFGRVAVTGEHQPEIVSVKEWRMRNLELPARMSPCLQLFIESLFDEVAGNRGASWHQNHDFQSALPKATKKEEDLENGIFQ